MFFIPFKRKKTTLVRSNPKASIMKTRILFIVLIGLFCIPMGAQENKTVKKETTVKKVVKKEGGKIITKEVVDVKKEKGKVLVEGTDRVDQQSEEAMKMGKDARVLQDEVTIDHENEMKKKAAEEKRKAELAASVAEQKAKAEEQKRLLEEQRKERLRMLEENRKKLQQRPKGMAKLKKDN